jgi:exopolyphosphatase/guanosine-5'-triphosphate,3'-diphosphate pyrophosphatase
MTFMGITAAPVFAAIDVGTNAVRLKLARRRTSGALQTLHQERDPLRPGEGVFRTGVIPETTATRLIQRMRDFAERCRFYDAHVRAVATSAMRDAQNRSDILSRVRVETGVELEVISGREEARLTCLGVLAGTGPDVASLCIDIGGGSTELALALGEHPTRLYSVDVGAFRLLDRIDPTGRFAPSALREVRERAFAAAAELPTTVGLRDAIACSGTIRALVEFANSDTRAYATRDEIAAAVDKLVAMGPIARRRHFEPRRADVVVTGALILEAVMRRLDLVTVRAVKRGLRDGVLVELARRLHDVVTPDQDQPRGRIAEPA